MNRGKIGCQSFGGFKYAEETLETRDECFRRNINILIGQLEQITSRCGQCRSEDVYSKSESGLEPKRGRTPTFQIQSPESICTHKYFAESGRISGHCDRADCERPEGVGNNCWSTRYLGIICCDQVKKCRERY
jgi:hypothetical protein